MIKLGNFFILFCKIIFIKKTFRFLSQDYHHLKTSVIFCFFSTDDDLMINTETFFYICNFNCN